MNNTRILAFGASAAITLSSGVAAVPAGAKGSHWSNAKCHNEYLRWYHQHFHNKISLTPKQTKQVNKYIVKLQRQHHCVLGG